MTIPFKNIRAHAEKRKGGAKALQKLLPQQADPKALAKLGDDRVLAEMTRRVFAPALPGASLRRNGPASSRRFSRSSRAGCRCSRTSSGTP
jgi:hypothetical protein